MSKHLHSWKKPKNPEGKPTACVVRFGAFGDTIQAASVCASLKKKGFWVMLMCSHPASEVVALDPNIDELMVFMQDQIPVNWLGHCWMWVEHHWLGKRFDKWCNLTESVEQNLLAVLGNVKYTWAPKARHELMNANYLEFQHQLAGAPYEPSFEFYETPEESKWASEEMKRMAKVGIERLIIWPLAGSSRLHKIYPHADAIWSHVLKHYPTWGIATVGDGSCADLEAGFEGEPRIWKTSGKWGIRQVCAMLRYAHVVVGPETGVMSAAAFMPMPKILFLSHSTVANLSRDWVRTTSIWAPETHCPGRGRNEVAACHKMIPSFEGCRRNDEFGTAQCVAEIKPEWVWEHLQRAMNEGDGGTWCPPLVGVTGDSA